MRVKALLEKPGLPGAAEYVEHATLPEMAVSRLADYSNATAAYFSMIIVYKGEEAWTLPPQSL